MPSYAAAPRRALLCLAAVLAVPGLPSTAHAEPYPARPVRLVVPYPPGSQVDNAARMLAPKLQAALNQQFVVDNRPGGSTIIGAEHVAKSAPDGYTLLVTTNTTQAGNVSLFKALPYDPIKDFAPVGRIVSTSLVMVARPDLPANTLSELVALARKSSKGLNMAHWSAGSQIAAAAFNKRADARLLMVPYKGSPPAVTDVAGSHADLTFTDFTTALPQIKAGKLKGLAVTSRERSSLTPDLPTLAETFPGLAVATWIGLVAPANTPAAVVDRLNRALNDTLKQADIQSRFADIGFEVEPSTPAEFARFIATEIEAWRQHIADAGIQPQ